MHKNNSISVVAAIVVVITFLCTYGNTVAQEETLTIANRTDVLEIIDYVSGKKNGRPPISKPSGVVNEQDGRVVSVTSTFEIKVSGIDGSVFVTTDRFLDPQGRQAWMVEFKWKIEGDEKSWKDICVRDYYADGKIEFAFTEVRNTQKLPLFYPEKQFRQENNHAAGSEYRRYYQQQYNSLVPKVLAYFRGE